MLWFIFIFTFFVAAIILIICCW
jgi:hypothetical protein